MTFAFGSYTTSSMKFGDGQMSNIQILQLTETYNLPYFNHLISVKNIEYRYRVLTVTHDEITSLVRNMHVPSA